MNLRALFLFGALLAAPSWAQEPANFDLSSDYIRKIVRDTAATQSVPVQLPAEKPAKREPIATVRYIPPEKPLPVKRAAPRPVAAPQSNEFLSTVFEILIEEALGIEDDLETETEPDPRLRCQARAGLNNTTQDSDTCPER